MKNRLLLAALATTSVWMGGCTVQPVVHDRAYPYEEAVVVAPPPLRYEYPGNPPHIDYVWIGGYWNWSTTRYIWVPGRWEAPRPGYYWAPHRWERDGDHWRQRGGTWERDHRPSPATGPAPAATSGMSRVLEQQLGTHRQATPPPAQLVPPMRPAPVAPAPQPPAKAAPPLQAPPVAAPRPERDDRRPSGAGDRPRVDRPGTPAAARPMPDRRDEAHPRPDATPRAGSGAAPRDGGGARQPTASEGTGSTERPRHERRKAPEEKRAAPEPRDASPARSDAAPPRMEARPTPAPPPAR